MNTDSTNITSLKNISKINHPLSPINFGLKNKIGSNDIDYTSFIPRRNLRKNTILSNSTNPLILSRTNNNNINLKIDILNSDKQDLINILSNENINKFTSNLNNQMNNKDISNNNYSQTSNISQNMDNLKSDKEKANNNLNIIKNSNLFLTKIDENSNINTRYSKFNDKMMNNKSQNDKPDELISSKENNINISNENKKEMIVHDIISSNNSKLKDNQNIFSNSNIINITSPKNLITENSNKKSINYFFTDVKEKDERKKINLDNINKLDLNKDKNNNNASRIRENSQKNCSLNKYIPQSPIKLRDNLYEKNNTISSNYDKIDDDNDEYETKFNKRKKKIKKSYGEILDFITKEYNLTEHDTNINKNRAASEMKKSIKMDSNNNNKNDSNSYNNNDLNSIRNYLGLNSYNKDSSLASEEYNFSCNRDKDSLHNFLKNGDEFSDEKPKIINTPRNDVKYKSREFVNRFLNRCNSQEETIEHIFNKMKVNLKKPTKLIDDKIDIVKKNIMIELNREIDKDVFMMDNKEIKKEKILLLLASEGKDGKKKFFFENRNSPLFVGELLTKINDEFAFKCRKLFINKFVNNENSLDKSSHQHRDIKEYFKNQKRLNVKHQEIEKVLYDIEASKNISIKKIISTINKNKDIHNTIFEEEM